MKTDPLEFGHILLNSQSIERSRYSQESTQETRSKAHLWIYKDLIRSERTYCKCKFVDDV